MLFSSSGGRDENVSLLHHRGPAYGTLVLEPLGAVSAAAYVAAWLQTDFERFGRAHDTFLAFAWPCALNSPQLLLEPDLLLGGVLGGLVEEKCRQRRDEKKHQLQDPPEEPWRRRRRSRVWHDDRRTGSSSKIVQNAQNVRPPPMKARTTRVI